MQSQGLEGFRLGVGRPETLASISPDTAVVLDTVVYNDTTFVKLSNEFLTEDEIAGSIIEISAVVEDVKQKEYMMVTKTGIDGTLTYTEMLEGTYMLNNFGVISTSGVDYNGLVVSPGIWCPEDLYQELIVEEGLTIEFLGVNKE